MRKAITHFTGTLPLVIGSGLLVACGGTDPEPVRGASAEATVPEASEAEPSYIAIVDDGAMETELAERRGSGLLVNFWAIWCAPCVAEMPELVEVAHEYADRGGSVVGVSYDLMVAGSDPDTIEADMRRFLDAQEIDIPVLIYDEVDYEKVNGRYSLPGEIPVTLAIDRAGNVVDRQHGKAGKERFAEMMEKALAP